MKPCIRCSEVKPLSEFYIHEQMADGHLNKCKSCCRAGQASRVSVLKHDPDWAAKERARCRKKQEKYRKSGRALPSKKGTCTAWRRRNPEKARAHVIAYRAVKSGLIKNKAKCEKCSKKRKLQKHHPDYTRPLHVEFLCSKCHGKEHRK